MSVYRHGEQDGFFDGLTTYNGTTNLRGGVTVPVGAISRNVQVGRDTTQLVIYLKASDACHFQVQVAHEGSETADDVFADVDNEQYLWHDLWYSGTANVGNSNVIDITIPSGGGAIAIVVPDFEPNWCRLKRIDSGGATLATVTGGWSGAG